MTPYFLAKNNMSFNTYEDAVNWGKKVGSNVDVMIDPKTDKYHVIHQWALNHWKQHYVSVCEIRVQMEITDLRQHKYPDTTITIKDNNDSQLNKSDDSVLHSYAEWPGDWSLSD